MKILGISGSPRPAAQSGVFTLVETVLENSSCEYELVSLAGKQISGCRACLGCAEDNVCKVVDDMSDLRELVVAADAYVIGAPNYYSTLNVATHAFLERWFQFRHQEGNLLGGKLAVVGGGGGTGGQAPAQEIEKFLLYNFVETVASVRGQGAASCYTCGYGETCKVGIPMMLHGPGVKVSAETTPSVRKQPEVMAAAVAAGKVLGDRLRQNHDRARVTQAMQERLLGMMSAPV